MNRIEPDMLEMGTRARAASGHLRLASADQRSSAISGAADQIEQNEAKILTANAADMQRATAKQYPAAFIDRLLLNPNRVAAIASTLRTIAEQPDPLGVELDSWSRPNGLLIRKVAVPLGVIGIIYESRPNVTADAAALCLRSANAAILRGGSDALLSSQAIFACIRSGMLASGLPEHSVQLIEHNDREAVGQILGGLNGQLDLVIPRGGKSLIARIQRDAKVPVLSHLEGICHVYVHHKAEPEMAVNIVLNSKMRRVGICGAAECLLIDQACADGLLPMITETLIKAGCQLRGDKAACAIDPRINTATNADWGCEFLAPILFVRVVANIDAAIAHIGQYGSGHTESIISQDRTSADTFQRQVDSAIVLHNASTQYADGGEFGFGAEIGIATGKLHARGPVGAAQLTSYQYQVDGNGQIRPT